MSKKVIILLGIMLVLLVFLVWFYFFLEGMIYDELNMSIPGDCGDFVVWMALLSKDKEADPAKITYQISPLVVITGPIVIQNNLAKLGIKSKFYNDFSIEDIKKKLDEEKYVIAVVNVFDTGEIQEYMGANHYLFIVKYDKDGFYFFDAFHTLGEYYKTGIFGLSFVSFTDFQRVRKNVLGRWQVLGHIENLIGFKKFAIIIGEEGKNNLSFFTRLGLYCEYILEKIIEFTGRVVVLISPRI